MQISGIRPNYASTNYQNRRLAQQNQIEQNTKPSFQGGLSNKEYERVMRLIAQKNTEIFTDFSAPKLKQVMDNLVKKYECLGVKSLALQISLPNDVAKFFGNQVKNIDVNGKRGLSVVVGNKYGPIESMDTIYEAKTFILKPNDFK